MYWCAFTSPSGEQLSAGPSDPDIRSITFPDRKVSLDGRFLIIGQGPGQLFTKKEAIKGSWRVYQSEMDITKISSVLNLKVVTIQLVKLWQKKSSAFQCVVAMKRFLSTMPVIIGTSGKIGHDFFHGEEVNLCILLITFRYKLLKHGIIIRILVAGPAGS